MNKYDGFHDFVVARGDALSRTAYLLVFGTTSGGATLDLPANGFAYHLPGCRREAGYHKD